MLTRRLGTIAATVASLWAAGTTSSRAGTAAVVVSGDIEAGARGAARSDAVQRLREQGWTIADREASRREQEALAACLKQEDAQVCSRVVRGWKGAERVFVISVEARKTAGETDIELTGFVISDAGQVLGGGRKFCERCQPDGMRAAVQALVDELNRQASAATVKTALDIRSRPAGARIMVDGLPVGVTDLVYTVFPGRHTVSIDKPGYRIEVRQVEAQEGVTVPVSVELQPSSNGSNASAASNGGSRPSTRLNGRAGRGALPWVLGAASVAAVGGGVILIAIDQDASDGSDQRRRFRDTALPGLGLTAAGVVLGGVATWMFLRPRKGAAPMAVATREGAWIGIRGDF